MIDRATLFFFIKENLSCQKAFAMVDSEKMIVVIGQLLFLRKKAWVVLVLVAR